MPYLLSKEEFYRWKMDPTGQEFWRAIRAARDMWAEHLVNGNTVESQVQTAQTIGIIRGMDTIINFEVED
jgi:hypothetical protein